MLGEQPAAEQAEHVRVDGALMALVHDEMREACEMLATRMSHETHKVPRRAVPQTRLRSLDARAEHSEPDEVGVALLCRTLLQRVRGEAARLGHHQPSPRPRILKHH